MANNISINVNTQIQISDLNTGGNPVIYSRNPLLSAVPAQNMLEQIVNIQNTFNVPISGTGNYSLFYARNLMPATSALILLVTITIAGTTVSFNLSAGGFILIGSPSLTNISSIPLNVIVLTSFSAQFPLLAEYAIASNGNI